MTTRTKQNNYAEELFRDLYASLENLRPVKKEKEEKVVYRELRTHQANTALMSSASARH